jgi:hypothetical protein
MNTTQKQINAKQSWITKQSWIRAKNLAKAANLDTTPARSAMSTWSDEEKALFDANPDKRNPQVRELINRASLRAMYGRKNRYAKHTEETPNPIARTISPQENNNPKEGPDPKVQLLFDLKDLEDKYGGPVVIKEAIDLLAELRS